MMACVRRAYCSKQVTFLVGWYIQVPEGNAVSNPFFVVGVILFVFLVCILWGTGGLKSNKYQE
jgi:predicted membrane chloride channel (bestrophin family)